MLTVNMTLFLNRGDTLHSITITYCSRTLLEFHDGYEVEKFLNLSCGQE